MVETVPAATSSQFTPPDTTQLDRRVEIRQSCNSVNVYTKSGKRLLNVYTNIAASNKNQMVFSYNNRIIVSNGHAYDVSSYAKNVTCRVIDCFRLFFIFSAEKFRLAVISKYINVFTCMLASHKSSK